MKRPVVLIVEDCLNDQALMQLAIEEASVAFPAVLVSDGQEALDWLFRQGAHAERDDQVFPVLVLLDLKMPHLSGLELLQALRKDPKGRLIPVMVLTTSEMPSDIEQAYVYGANAYVQKPMGFPALVSLVQSIHAFWLTFNVIHPMLR